MTGILNFISLILVIYVIHSCCKIEEDEIKDIDGNVYKTVVIGNQVWMAENLKTSRYNDGVKIPNVPDPVQWNNLLTISYPPPGHELTYEIIGAFCWFDNDSSAYNNDYGKLYNFGVAESVKICPEGWHVPTSQEWHTLIDPYKFDPNDPTGVSGNELMEASANHWNQSTGTNETGFTALPGGIRNDDVFTELGLKGYFWSSERGGISYGAQGLFQPIPYDSEFPATPLSGLKNVTCGLSIRCIKDN